MNDASQYLGSLGRWNGRKVAVDQTVHLGIAVATAIRASPVGLGQRDFRALKVLEARNVRARPDQLEGGERRAVLTLVRPLRRHDRNLGWDAEPLPFVGNGEARLGVDVHHRRADLDGEALASRITIDAIRALREAEALQTLLRRARIVIVADDARLDRGVLRP